MRKAWEHEYVIQLLPEARASFPGVAHVLHALVLVRAVAVQGARRVQGDVPQGGGGQGGVGGGQGGGEHEAGGQQGQHGEAGAVLHSHCHCVLSRYCVQMFSELYLTVVKLENCRVPTDVRCSNPTSM